MTTEELREERERLTALVNVLGFASLDHLEDYVIIHGAARLRVVPASSVAAAGASLPVEDTQLDLSYNETTHAQRNEERKRENLRLKSEIEELWKELNWLRVEYEKKVDGNERLKKDKSRLLDSVEEANRKANEAIERGGEGGGNESFGDEIAALLQEAQALYEQNDQLDEIIISLEEEKDSAMEACDELVAKLEDAQAAILRLQRELEEAESDIAQLESECQDTEHETARLRSVEAEYNAFKLHLGAFVPQQSSTNTTPAPARPRTSSVSRTIRTLPRSAPSTSTRATTPHVPSRLRNSTPILASSLTRPMENRPPTSGPSTPTIQSSSTALPPSVSGPATPVPPPSNFPAAVEAKESSSSTSSAAAVPIEAHSSVTKIAQPDRIVSSTSTTAIPLKDVATPIAAPSSTSSRLTSVQTRQLKQYPLLLSAYLSAVASFSSAQHWATKVIPSLEPDLLSSLPSAPPVPTYPSVEFPAFEELPVTKGADGKVLSSAWIEDGTLGKRYTELEESEKKAAWSLADWKSWIERAKKAVQEKKDSGGGGGAREKRSGTPMATAGSTKTVVVKKRRRVSKEGVEGTSNSIVPFSIASHLPSTSKGPASSSTTGSPVRSASSSRQLRSLAPPVGPRVVEGETQLPPTPEKERPSVYINGVLSTGKRKMWNLLSPTKKKSPSSARVPSGSPRKLSPAKRPAVKVLVDDTQPQELDRPDGESRPAEGVIDDSETGEEPDTLESTEGPEPDTLLSTEAPSPPRPRSRSSSRSPRKQSLTTSTTRKSTDQSRVKRSPLRRTTAVAHESTASPSGPKPPFSPAYAAKMSKAATATEATIPSSSPARASPLTSTSRLPFQPSPNRNSQASRSPSSSPTKQGLLMPPSAQQSRISRGVDKNPFAASRSVTDDGEDEEEIARGLLFSKGRPKSPTKRKKEKGKGKEVVVKEEETDDDPFAAAGSNTNTTRERSEETKSPSPKKKKPKRKSDGQDREKSAKKARKSTGPLKVESASQESEDIGDMPQGYEEEEARRLWISKVQKKRHEKVLRLQQEKAKNSPKVQLELNPDRNQGQTHAFKQTERKKAVRQSMVAEACGNCEAYYDRKMEAVPVGRCNHVGNPGAGSTSKGGWLDTRAAEAEKRMQQDGRHRAAQRVDPEPPDYWQMGFPSTQQAEDINARAKEIKAEKEQYKRAEAEQANGLYRYRNEDS